MVLLEIIFYALIVIGIITIIANIISIINTKKEINELTKLNIEIEEEIQNLIKELKEEE